MIIEMKGLIADKTPYREPERRPVIATPPPAVEMGRERTYRAQAISPSGDL